MRFIEADAGFEAGAELLCSTCYFVLWGPVARRGSDADEARRPVSRQPEKGVTRWMPGPLGELDLSAKVTEVFARRRR